MLFYRHLSKLLVIFNPGRTITCPATVRRMTETQRRKSWVMAINSDWWWREMIKKIPVQQRQKIQKCGIFIKVEDLHGGSSALPSCFDFLMTLQDVALFVRPKRSSETDYEVHYETLLVRIQCVCWGCYRWTLPRGSVAPDSISASPHPLFPGTDVLQGASGGVCRHCVDQVMSQPLHSGSDFIPLPSGDREGWGHYFDLPAVIPLSERGPGEGGVKVDSFNAHAKKQKEEVAGNITGKGENYEKRHMW